MLSHFDVSASSPPHPPGLRAYITGAALCAFVGVGTATNMMVIHGSYMAIDFSAAAAVFLFFVWTAGVNPLLGRVRRQWAYRRDELRVMYVMMLVACAIPTMGVVAQLLPIITSPFYFATAENSWAEMIQPHIPSWLVPEGTKTIRDFYEGFSGMEHEVPWGAWARPLLAWGTFLAALYVVSISLMVILRRQWMEHERLVYPLAQLPMEMSGSDDGKGYAAIYRQTAMWVGFGIAFGLGSLTGIHHYMPTVPYLEPEIGFPIFRNVEYLRFRVSMPLMGFFYLVHLDVAFSMWFFNLLSLAVRGLMKVYNLRLTENLGIYGSRSPVFAHQGMGAITVLVLGGLWSARRHLADVLRKALRSGTDVGDSGEIMSYRAAIVCIVVGTLYMVGWLAATGMPLWVTLTFLGAAMALFLGLTRIVAESGMAEAVASTIGSSFVISGFGSRAIGPRGLVSLALTYVWGADIRTFVMASTANGLRIVEGVSGGRRRVFWGIVAAIVVAFVSSVVTYLPLAYQHGGLNGNDWFFGGGAVAPYEFVIGKLLNPEPPNMAGWALKGVGAAGMLLLMGLRTRFLWFPFHPIGFAIGPIWMMDHLWFTVFVAWLAKWSLLRIGGIRLYRRGRPIFLGFILGQFVCNGTWLVIDFLTGTQGNRIFWI